MPDPRKEAVYIHEARISIGKCMGLGKINISDIST